MTTLDRSTPETDIAALVDAVRAAPERRDELVALLPERAALHAGRTAAEVTRLRGYALAAFADTGLPATGLPYVLEALESGHMPYEIAGAAIAVRGLADPPAELVAYLVRAVSTLRGNDATLTFERYAARRPFARPTTALTEVLRTLGGLGARAAGALPELERLSAQRERYPRAVIAEMQAAVRTIRSAPPAERECCHAMPLVDEAAPAGEPIDVALEDQDGREETYAGFFGGRPGVVAFFYTRCESPYKCSLTVTKLARLQALAAAHGLAGSLRLAAITYDPAFDIPARLKRYGTDRGVVFGEDMRFFRTVTGFDALSQYFRLGVNYGPSTVNRHRIETYVLDASGAVAAAFTRMQWDPEDVLASVRPLSK